MTVQAVLCALFIGATGTSIAHAQSSDVADDTVSAARVPTLKRLIALAVEHAPEVIVGRSALRASESSYVGARLWPLQNPYFEVTASRSNRVGNQGTLFVGAAWVPFEVSGQRTNRIAEAKAYVGIHQVELEQSRAQARAAAVRAWGRAVVETERIRTLGDIANSAESEAKAFRARRDAGDATERDAQLAEVEHARHLMLVEEAKAALAGALGEMERVTGLPWSQPANANVHPEAVLERMRPRVAAAQSPFVRASRAQADYYAKTDSKWASEATGPVSLMLSGGQGTTGETVVGAGVAWTLPTFRRFQGERARAQAERERALSQSNATQREIETRLNTTIRELASVRSAILVLDTRALPAARAARGAAEQMFSMGKIDILSVLVSRRDEALLRLKHLDLAEQEWSLLANWVELSGELP